MFEPKYQANCDEASQITSYAKDSKPKDDFNEGIYLTKYPDVAASVRAGVIPSGKWHYLKYGKQEGRTSIADQVLDNSPVWKAYKEWAIYHRDVTNFDEFKLLMSKIEKEEGFQLARYNDGEWVFMLQIPVHFSNCIRNHNHNREEVIEISEKLLKIIDSTPDYYIGIDSTTRALHGLISTVRKEFTQKVEKLKNIVYGDLFNAATIRFGIDALLNPLRKRFVILVGPNYMSKLKITALHVQVPSVNCWSQTLKIDAELNSLIKDHLNKKPVIVYACSLLAKLLIDYNYKRYGNQITQLDVGSCIDPWCGLISRPWHRELAKHYQLPASVDGLETR